MISYVRKKCYGFAIELEKVPANFQEVLKEHLRKYNIHAIESEMPTEINSDLWNNTEKYLPKIWEEVKKMKFIKKNERYISYKIFNIPKTLSVPLLNFEDSKRKLLNHIKTNYQNKIETPGLGVITRKKFIESTNNLIKKYE